MLPAMSNNSMWVLYIGCALAILAVTHLAKFVVKRDMMVRAGGYMGNHFVQAVLPPLNVSLTLRPSITSLNYHPEKPFGDTDVWEGVLG